MAIESSAFDFHLPQERVASPTLEGITVIASRPRRGSESLQLPCGRFVTAAGRIGPRRLQVA